MDIRTLQYFVEVVRFGGFSRAAKKIHSTQSTLSKAVRQLEDQMNLKLLERQGHVIRMTEAGEIVFRRAQTILVQCADLRFELEEYRGLQRGKLRLGIPLIGSSNLFAHWFSEYRNRYPGIELQLVEHGSKKLEEMVKRGEIDLAASLLPVSEEFDWQELRREPVDLLIHAGHPLAQKHTVTVADLANEPFILFGTGFVLNQIIVNTCLEKGFSPRIVAESSQVDFVIELVASRLGIAFLPRMIAEERHHPTTRRIPIVEPEIYWHLALIWRHDSYLSPSAQAWLNYFSDR